MATITTKWTLAQNVANAMNAASAAFDASIQRVENLSAAASSPIDIDINTAKVESARAHMQALENEIQAKQSANLAIADQLADAAANARGAADEIQFLKGYIAELQTTARGLKVVPADMKEDLAGAQKALAEHVSELKKSEAVTTRLNAAYARNEAQMSSLANEAVRSAERVRKLGDDMGSAGRASDVFGGKLKSLLGKFIGFQALKAAGRWLKNWVSDAFSGAMEREQSVVSLAGVLGQEAGERYAAKLQASAGAFSFDDMLNNTRVFASYTKHEAALDRLNEQTKRLMLLDPTQGLEGAGFAMKEMLGGSFTSLKGRFGMSSADIASIKEGAKTYEDLMNNFDKWLEKRGATSQMLQEYENSASASVERLQNTLGSKATDVGSAILNGIAPYIQELNVWLESPAGQAFFASLVNGAMMVVNGLISVKDFFGQMVDFISENSAVIEPVIWGLVGAFAAYKAVTLLAAIVSGIMAAAQGIGAVAAGGYSAATFAATAAQSGLNAAVWACPLTWLVVIIIAAIAALVALARKFEGVRQVIAYVGAAIVSVFDYAVAAVLLLFEGMYNTVVGIINAIIGGLNKLGFEIKTIDYADFGRKALNRANEKFGERAEAYKAGLDEFADMSLSDILGADIADIVSSSQTTADATAGLDNGFGDWSAGGGGSGGGGGAPVKVTNDELSNELIKMLRERDEGINLRREYVTYHQETYVTGNNLHAVTDESVDDLFDRMGRKVNEERSSSPHVYYPGKAL